MGKMQRQKGASYERHIAGRLREVYPNARRGIGQSRSAGEVPDVDGTPWWVELKHRKVVNILAALAQADKDRLESNNLLNAVARRPLVIARRDRERDVAAMLLDDLIALLRELEAWRKEGQELRTEIEELHRKMRTMEDIMKDRVA
jgi:hypothetical protein